MKKKKIDPIYIICVSYFSLHRSGMGWYETVFLTHFWRQMCCLGAKLWIGFATPTHFYLKKPLEVDDGDVYLFGGMTEFQIDPAFKMEYDAANKRYHARILLKQGFYNYQYAFVSDAEPDTIDLSEIEGDWFETENDYYILVYYRPFGSRYDQLVGLNQINTRG